MIYGRHARGLARAYERSEDKGEGGFWLELVTLTLPVLN